ncbi:MAG: GNAT family N-acetyltransferase [Thermodesulfobacteriota bacterium]|nr:GNAT family N-acetyltransferase [Thermodesulfobacteriota bacterium]
MDDVQALVCLHSEVFKGYNSTAMGPGYLRSLYSTLACHVLCISIVASAGDRILGWIGGVGDWRAYQKALLLSNIVRGPAILFSVLRNRPRLLKKALVFVWEVLLQFLQPPRARDALDKEAGSSRQAALLAIGVAPCCQNQGLSQEMMTTFHRRLLLKGYAACTASTFSDNHPGNRAFQKAGYRLYQTSNGVNYYSKELA